MPVNDIWQWNCELKEASGETGLLIGCHRLTTEVEPNLSATGVALLDKIRDFLALLATELMPDNVSSVCLSAKRIAPSGGRVIAKFDDVFSGGISSTDTVAAQLAVVVTKYTNVETKSGRGRVYIPFLAETLQTSGVLTTNVESGIQAEIDDVWKDAFTDAASNEWEGVVWSKKLGQANLITDLVLRPVLGTQRRRANHHQAFFS